MSVLSTAHTALAFPVFRRMALAAGLLLVAACASQSGGPARGLDSGTALPPPAAGENAAGENAGGSGALPVVPAAPLPAPSSTSQPPANGGEPVVVKGPDGTEWTASTNKDSETYQADIEDCYRYAAAQTRRDAQFIDDRNAGIDTLTNQSPYSGLRQRVDEYDLRNRRTSLMSSCMESKGYARADTVLPRLEF
ncbi:hypothetical protein [Pelagibius sp. 7325]|uniref:hypothetical protein n=1 Tax=Pelagibius sp. 7325 TaxID=3131994 RepID=UPI0030EC316E